jgi:tyrosine-protein phosphatase SIW14
MPSAKPYRRLVPGVLAVALSLAGLQAASLSEVPGVSNFHQVNEHVYRGAQPHGEGFAGLAKLGIKTVIDLRGERSEQTAVESSGMRYVRLPWSGYKAPDNSQIATVLGLLNDNSAWPVFVHCRRGADRTGTAIACYRIAHDHWSNQQALDEAKSFGMSPLESAMQHFILHFSVPAAQAAVTAVPATILAPVPASLP